MVRNSNSALVNARIQNNNLVLSYRPAPIKTATITVRATNLLGQFIQDTFLVTVQQNPATVGNDVLSGTNADNRIDGLRGNDRIFGFGGNDQLIGRLGRDRINGGAENDRLDGGADADSLLGAGGRDRLIGGLGSDTLTGGTEADQFVFDIGRTFQTSSIGIDVVTDFQRPDKLILDRTTFTALSSNQVSFQAVGTLAQAQSSRALFTYIRATGALYYNQNRQAAGFGSGGQFADFSNGLSVAASDFLIQA
ncbi:calcium-binding protein [Leptolyngbya sp. FACHB-8]|uniref:calcium-binding protein n=1 Tax=unclassified Leptolyngbya TaxID=2650499 RepID=UPI0032202144